MRRNGMMVLALVGVLGFVACDEDDENRYTASLTGAAEKPNAVNTTATANFTLTDNGATMNYVLTLTNPIVGPIVGAHIHAIPRSGVAPADTTGPIVVDLGFSNVTTGVISQNTFDAADIRSLATGQAAISMDSLRTLINAGRTYVNVHTQANPGGHIRGTLVRSN